MTMVEEDRVLLVKSKVLESQGVIKGPNQSGTFLNFIWFLEKCVVQETLELSISTEHIDFFKKTVWEGF